LHAALTLTVMLHDCFAPTLAPQVFVCENNFDPAKAMPLMYSVAFPASVSDTACGGLHLTPHPRKHEKEQPKDRLVGDNVTVVLSAPVPLRVTFCGLPVALSAIDPVEVRSCQGGISVAAIGYRRLDCAIPAPE